MVHCTDHACTTLSTVILKDAAWQASGYLRGLRDIPDVNTNRLNLEGLGRHCQVSLQINEVLQTRR